MEFNPTQIPNRPTAKRAPMRCPYCRSRMIVLTPDQESPIGLRNDAQRLPVHVQCPDCGYAPALQDQPVSVKRLLDESLQDLELACMV